MDLTKEYLESLSADELCDMLSAKTMELVHALSEKPQKIDGEAIRYLKYELKKIQSAYNRKHKEYI